MWLSWPTRHLKIGSGLKTAGEVLSASTQLGDGIAGLPKLFSTTLTVAGLSRVLDRTRYASEFELHTLCNSLLAMLWTAAPGTATDVEQEVSMAAHVRKKNIVLNQKVIGWVEASWPSVGKSGLGRRVLKIAASDGVSAMKCRVDLPPGTIEDWDKKSHPRASAFAVAAKLVKAVYPTAILQ